MRSSVERAERKIKFTRRTKFGYFLSVDMRLVKMSMSENYIHPTQKSKKEKKMANRKMTADKVRFISNLPSIPQCNDSMFDSFS